MSDVTNQIDEPTQEATTFTHITLHRIAPGIYQSTSGWFRVHRVENGWLVENDHHCGTFGTLREARAYIAKRERWS